MVISARGNNIRNCLAEARRVAGLSLRDSRLEDCAAHGDGLYRAYLVGGTVVEIEVAQRTKCTAYVAHP